MKKLLTILLSFLFLATAYADEQEELFSQFNKWLFQNEYNEFIKLEFAEGTGKCKGLKKFSQHWYYNECDKFKKVVPNYKVKTYNGRSEIPEKGANPNYETLLYYYWNYTEYTFMG